jgi:hypothetical protein
MDIQTDVAHGVGSSQGELFLHDASRVLKVIGYDGSRPRRDKESKHWRKARDFIPKDLEKDPKIISMSYFV